jgi:NADH-quinone oxidoreductase subunit G
MAITTDQVTLTVDGKSVTVPKGTLILDAAKKLGIEIPIFCSHPKMEPVAVCRMCLIEVEKMPKLQPACAVYVSDGMVVRTRTDQVRTYQNGVLEFLLTNHPLDCPICDKGGECPLQDQTYAYGPGASRYDFPKKHFDKAVPLSDKILLDRERCILCWRCTRFSEEISGERELALIERGKETMIGTFNNEPATSEYQGNWTEICPVGALTSRQYRFVSRPWDLDRTASICPGCSMGCNIHLDARSNRVGRFQSRENLAVDDGWLCDFGRYSFPSFQRDGSEKPRVRRDGRLYEVSYEQAIAAAADALASTGGAVAGWVSPAATNEELFLFQRLFREVLGSTHLDHRAGSKEAQVGLEPDDATLPIADLERCDHVVVLGGQAVIDAAPVLHLRLTKSERRGVHVLKTNDVKAALDGVPAEAQVVGILATASRRAEAVDLQAKLATKISGSVRRLLVVRGPNGRGAIDIGILPAQGPGFQALDGRRGRPRSEWEAAGVLGAYLYEASPLHGFEASGEELEWLGRLQTVVLQRPRPSPLDEVAHVILPGRAVTEKTGTWTNMEGRLQQVREGIDAAALRDDWKILQSVAHACGADWAYTEVDDVFRDLSAALPPYQADRIGERLLWSERT